MTDREARPVNRRAYGQTRRGRFVKVRPERVARGLALAIAMRASRRMPVMTDALLDDIIEDIARHELVPEHEVSAVVAHGSVHGKRKPMTARQAEVLQGLADGLAYKEVAARLGTATPNVARRVEAAKFALSAKTTLQAVAIAVEHRFVRGAPLPDYEAKGRRPIRPTPRARPHEGPLTERELQVLTLAAAGLSNAEIAVELELSEHAVKSHMSRIQERLDANGRLQSVVIAIRRGLIT